MASLDADCLLDTGPLVALLSEADPARERCAAEFAAMAGRLVTTEAVITEAMHLMRRARGGQQTCFEFILRGGAVVAPLSVPRFGVMAALMARYHDVPMDYADASLVALGEELGIGRVFTLDRRGFSTYRWRKTKRFQIVPSVSQ